MRILFIHPNCKSEGPAKVKENDAVFVDKMKMISGAISASDRHTVALSHRFLPNTVFQLVKILLFFVSNFWVFERTKNYTLIFNDLKLKDIRSFEKCFYRELRGRFWKVFRRLSRRWQWAAVSTFSTEMTTTCPQSVQCGSCELFLLYVPFLLFLSFVKTCYIPLETDNVHFECLCFQSSKVPSAVHDYFLHFRLQKLWQTTSWRYVVWAQKQRSTCSRNQSSINGVLKNCSNLPVIMEVFGSKSVVAWACSYFRLLRAE